MKKYAYITNNKVQCILELEEEQLAAFHSDTVIVSISSELTPKFGFLYDANTNSFIDPDPDKSIEKASLKVCFIDRIKLVAAFRISDTMSDIRQRNSLYRLYELGKKTKSSLAVDEKSEIADLEAKWIKINAIRDASNKIEEEINNLQTTEEIQTYDIQTNPLWPK